ncbi:hypothetical protein [Glycomyces tarimensis]
MSRAAHTPHRIRARYLRALRVLPLQAGLPGPIDPDRLTVLGTDTIAGRTVKFGTMTSAPRMWIAFADIEPALLGYMTGLVVGEPDLWICETAHRDWVLEGDNTRRLNEAAAVVWFACERDDG